MDFNSLHKDVLVAVEADKKYKLQNDAKFRAVEQKVESYDQFVALVKGSSLKPLDKKESLTTLSRSVACWNSSAASYHEESKFSSDIKKYFPPRNSQKKIDDDENTKNE